MWAQILVAHFYKIQETNLAKLYNLLIHSEENLAKIFSEENITSKFILPCSPNFKAPFAGGRQK